MIHQRVFVILLRRILMSPLKGRFHETMKHAKEREKTANDQTKLIAVADLIGRPTNILSSFH